MIFIKKNLILILLVLFIFNITTNAQIVGTVVALTGNVQNEVTREAVGAVLIVYNEQGEKVNAARSNPAEGGYFYITGLKPGNKYRIEIKQRSFLNEVYDLEIPNIQKYQEISKDFLIKPKERGTEIKIPVPPFELNKSKLRFGSEKMLENYSNVLKNNAEVKIEISCFPDNNVNPAENIKTTEERAAAIKEFMMNNGVEENRISIKGSKTTDPKNPLPAGKSAKGKRYIGTSYIIIKDF